MHESRYNMYATYYNAFFLNIDIWFLRNHFDCDRKSVAKARAHTVTSRVAITSTSVLNGTC